MVTRALEKQKEEDQVQGQPGLQGQFQASLGYVKLETQRPRKGKKHLVEESDTEMQTVPEYQPRRSFSKWQLHVACPVLGAGPCRRLSLDPAPLVTSLPGSLDLEPFRGVGENVFSPHFWQVGFFKFLSSPRERLPRSWNGLSTTRSVIS